MSEKFPIARPDVEPKNKKSFRERILNSKTAKIATILLMLSSSSPKMVEAANDNNPENDPENPKNKMEDTKINLNNIITFVDNNDKSVASNLNYQKIKTFQFSGGQEVVIGENNSFTMVVTNEGQKVFYDDNSDGSLDRVILNQDEEENRKLVHNAMYAFQTMEDLAEEADVVASINPKNVKILAIDHEGNQVEIIDMSSEGGTGVFSGGSDTDFVDKLQARYQTELETISGEINN